MAQSKSKQTKVEAEFKTKINISGYHLCKNVQSKVFRAKTGELYSLKNDLILGVKVAWF